MRAPGGGDLGLDARRAAAGAAERATRSRASAETLNEMLDAARGRLRARAAVRRRRKPRAADAARAAEDRARARPAPAADPRGARGALRSASEETDRLARLAEDLLLIARSDAGELPIRRERGAGGRGARASSRGASRLAAARARPLELCRRTGSCSTPTRRGSSRRSATSSTTRSRTARADRRSRREPRGELVELHVEDERTGLPAGVRRPARSTASAARTRRAAAAAAAWGSRSSRLIAEAHGGAAGAGEPAAGGADVWIAVPAGAILRRSSGAVSSASHLPRAPWVRDEPPRHDACAHATHGVARLRRATRFVVFGATALAGAFAGLAAHSAPGPQGSRGGDHDERRCGRPPGGDDQGTRRGSRPAPTPPPPVTTTRAGGATGARDRRARVGLVPGPGNDRAALRRRGRGPSGRARGARAELGARRGMQPFPRRLRARPRSTRRRRRTGAGRPAAVRSGRGGPGRRRQDRRPRRPDGRPDAAAGRLRPALREREAARRTLFHPSFAPVPGLAGGELDPARARSRWREASSSTSARPPRRSPPTGPPSRRGASGAGVLVSLGGDVARRGPVPTAAGPSASPTTTRARRRARPDGRVRRGGLATSGTTVRRWRAGEATLHHIVDPRTGRPRRHALADGHGRGRVLRRRQRREHGRDRARRAAPAWLAARGLPARLVRDDGEVTTSAAGRRSGGVTPRCRTGRAPTGT